MNRRADVWKGRLERAKSSNLAGEGEKEPGRRVPAPLFVLWVPLDPRNDLGVHPMEEGKAVSGPIFLLILLSLLSQLPQSLGTAVTWQAICCTGPFSSFLRTSGLTQELENPAKVERELESLQVAALASCPIS